ncbi:hypothetical protein [Amycolatopsis sp. H20-H5]|uniref:hypothetical protein n=1 Tax=Amycolatopsis sp. H20-H5 TaxID=3046309 RepID=UPI002DBE3B4F|nr:hypothetical protein [Amycolatopsis sp. H20-H5]MEC3975854.1 hypothetical protein [Amycolatopsis sp. H20-H5]
MPSETDIAPDTLTSWVNLLDGFLEAVTRRTDGGWSPVFASQAEREVRETAKLLRVDGSGDSWGRDPACTVYAATEMLAHTIIDHVRSLRSLMVTGVPASTSVDALARGALEAASTIWWLTDRAITARTRVARLYVVRRESAMEFERVAAAMQVPPSGGYGQSIVDLDSHYRDTLGLAEMKTKKKDDWAGSEGQRPLGYTKKVNNYLRAMGHPSTTGVYNFLSASAHAQLWRLQYGYADMVGPDGSTRLYQYFPQSFLRVGIGIAAESLAHSIRLSFEILGRHTSIRDIWQYAMPINRAFAIP